MNFKFKNKITGEVRTIWLSPDVIQDRLSDELYEDLADTICHCQPIGETNVVDCNCEDIIEQFELVPITA